MKAPLSSSVRSPWATIPLLLSSVATLLLPAAWGQSDEANKDGPAKGHSYHGDVFNEGPRQAALLIPGTGGVNFPVTTKSPEAQKFFNQGIGQLHGFWDFEAERSFRQAAAIDPDCAMAYWGMAQANFSNADRVEGFIKEAAKRRDKVSEREQLYIDGLSRYFDDPKKDTKVRLRELVRVYEGVIEKYPDDLEAKAFLAKQLYFNNRSGIKYTSHYTHDLLIGEILAADHDHPVHHYRIHLWDNEKPENAVESAALCGPAAPAIAHMWHMPGHAYSKLKRYHDATWQQEASARIDHAHMIRYQIVPDQIHNFAHNNEWLVRNLNHVGRAADALDLARNMIEMPRLAKFEGEGEKKKYKPNGSWRYGRQRLRDTLLRFELWESLITHAENSHYLPSDPTVIPELEWNRLLGIAKFETGDSEGAAVHLEKLETLLAETTTKRDKAVADAEKKARDAKKNDKQIGDAKKAAEKNFTKELTARENAANEVRVYAALNAEPADPERALELLPKLKNVGKSRHATLWQRAGNEEKAIELAEEAVKSGKNEVHPLATQVALLHAAGKTEEAKTAFETLRTTGAWADLDLPALVRLDPIAKEFEFPADWRTPPEPAEDLGERPELDDLGPFRWSPPKAAAANLSDAYGTESNPWALHRGRPFLLIFYLGKECSHCMDQLNDFAPLADEYEAAGIPIIAISTDTVKGLGETFQKTPDAEGNPRNPFPFPLLSNADLDLFKAYRAYDDFEDLALHGTFLIDGEGRIRWQDISYEPFMHAEWLLEECRRVLSFDES